MFVGFDYGSANCAIGVMIDDAVTLLPLSADSDFMPSTLYAMDRELIAEAVYQGLSEPLKAEYSHLRSSQLMRAKQMRHELDLMPNEQAVFVGQAAIDAYLEMPEEGFYVRSPKSFLGANGLRPDQIGLFEDIVTLMMQHVKSLADKALQQKSLPAATHAVIGRPVNFQGIGGEDSNQQAETILRLAASRAGFTEVTFLFEPLAAGMDFESTLDSDNTVLVVDVGGGTTDCSVVTMGPSHSNNIDRTQDCLGHSGQRIGGNDLDIALAMTGLMPSFGADTLMTNGKPMPRAPFWNAVSVNDISAQRDFVSLASRKLVESMIKEAEQPQLLKRLQTVQKNQLSYQVVRQAEAAKISLSDADSTQCSLDFIEKDLFVTLSADQFEQAISDPLAKVEALMQQAMNTAMTQAQQQDCTLPRSPDIVYVTGGTARSPAIYQKIASVYPAAKVVVGDHFGSVTAGLTRCAQYAFN
ncbi:molecular chaperone [Shewanella algicola]|uniref:Molecular chaperone n=1 Tax=Shewanella algicola TaxID=640633 RepID=A0A9X1Z3J1_9GAMM|nr:molecular chaperone [Shewanella algicola]MCL1104167.1 molecular chaperone [Shewanella algicola]GGP39627.1 molecular chaperone [Shewanella algicola]